MRTAASMFELVNVRVADGIGRVAILLVPTRTHTQQDVAIERQNSREISEYTRYG